MNTGEQLNITKDNGHPILYVVPISAMNHVQL